MTRPTAAPVLVVGAGPSGLVTALSLARQGVRSVLVERHPGTSTHPRASGVSVRSMEIFRRLGVEDDVRAFSLSARPMMAMSATLVASDRRVQALGFPTAEQAAAISPSGPAISPQDHVEPVLVRHIRKLGLTDIRFSTELVTLEQGPSGVEATVVDRVSGEQSVIRAGWVIGADGGRSTVRRLIGVDAIGPTGLERRASILFRADLWERLGEARYGLYAVGAPGGPPAVFAPMGPDDRWVLALPADRDRVEALAANPHQAREAIRAAAGVPDLELDVLAVLPLDFGGQLAARWRVGSVFLVGDAAHRMPPFGARGMNTAVADAYNLAWKLAWVERGIADPALLDSYEAERGPVGRRNVSLALARFPREVEASGLALDLPTGGDPNGTPDGLLEDLGYVYRSGAVAVEPPADPPDPASRTVAAGARAPHAWLVSEARSVSTLDLAPDRLLLLVQDRGEAWRRAAAALRAPGPVTLALGALGPALPAAVPVPLSVVSVGEDVTDRDGGFRTALGLEPGGAVVVRPDGHVVARWATAPADHRAALARAVSIATGHGDPATATPRETTRARGAKLAAPARPAASPAAMPAGTSAVVPAAR